MPGLEDARAVKMHELRQRQWLPVSREEAWEFFASPENLEALTPPDVGFRNVSPPEHGLYDGRIICHKIRAVPMVWVTWVSEIKCVEQGKVFVDEQRSGPFKFWQHRHTFEEGDGGVWMDDVVRYALPMGIFGEIAHGLFVRRQLEAVFRYRFEALERKFGKRCSFE